MDTPKKSVVIPQRRPVCLVMVVKDLSSADKLEITLRSVTPFVDTFYIYLTEQSKDLKGKVESLLPGMTGTIHEGKWVNQDHNQTLALLHARKNYPNGWSWVMEPGEEIKVSDQFSGWISGETVGYTQEKGIFWGGISDQVTSLEMKVDVRSCHYTPPKILSNLFEWYYQDGMPRLDEQQQSSRLSPIITCQSTATMGNILKIARGLKPVNSKDAKKFFKLCTTLDGDVGTKYDACLELISLSSKPEKKQKYAWKAVELDPKRFEAPERILAHAVAQRKAEAYTREMVAMGMLVRSKNPSEDSWSFSDAFSLALYYTGFYQQSAEECLRALKKCPEQQKQRLTTNLKFATDAMS